MKKLKDLNINFNDTLLELIDLTSNITISNPEGHFVYANNKFLQTTGYTFEELDGKNYRILNSDYHDKEFFKDLWATIKSKKVWHGDLRNKRKNGEYYWVNAIISPIIEEDKIIGYISIRREITQEKESELQLIHTSKMAALGEMASSIGHEIKNPLAIISGKTQLCKIELKKDTPNIQKVLDHLNQIENTSERIAKTVEGLRKYAHGNEKSPFETISIYQLLNETLPLCQTRLKNKSILMDLEMGIDKETKVFCRANEIEQVLIILINNAFDAIEGTIEPWVKIKVNKLNDVIKIEVVDSGLGIPKIIQNKIMEQYFTTKTKNKGTGIGLSIAKRIMTEHEGRLYLDPEQKNTTFIVELPLNLNS